MLIVQIYIKSALPLSLAGCMFLNGNITNALITYFYDDDVSIKVVTKVINAFGKYNYLDSVNYEAHRAV